MFTEYLFILLFTDHVENGVTIPVFNNFECARSCIHVRKGSCSSYFYKKSTRSCRLSHVRYASAVSLNSDTGYAYYIRRPECWPPWDYAGGQCYQLQLTPAKHSDASANCIKIGGYLAKTDSTADGAIIQKYADIYGGFWIGGTDVGHQGQWVWLKDGEPITLDMWADDQPDNGDQQDCLEQWGSFPGWNDGLCWYPLKYLCEK